MQWDERGSPGIVGTIVMGCERLVFEFLWIREHHVAVRYMAMDGHPHVLLLSLDGANNFSEETCYVFPTAQNLWGVPRPSGSLHDWPLLSEIT